MSLASPDIRNYYIGKGVVSFKKAGSNTWRDVGNVPKLEFTPKVSKIDHFSSRSGIKTKDRTIVQELSGEIVIEIEEWTAENLALALLGDVSQDTAGKDVVSILSSSTIEGEIKFTGANDVGPRFEFHYLSVSFTPGKSLSLIGDSVSSFELQGDVLAVNGSFGTVTEIQEGQ